MSTRGSALGSLSPLSLKALFLTMILFSTLSSYSISSVAAESEWRVIKAQKPAKASLIPKELISQIAKDLGTEKLEKKFLSAEVMLFDKHHLFEAPIKVITPTGGGTIDLEALLPQGKARFSMKIKILDGANAEVIPDRIYFVPKVKKSVNGQEVNCGYFYNVTNFTRKNLLTEDGFETYLSEGIYASLFVGSFVFVKVDPEKKIAHLGNINFTDTRFPNCPLE